MEVDKPELRSFRAVAGGPYPIVKRMNAFVINGYRFYSRKRDDSKKTQNFGVIVEVESKICYKKNIVIIEFDYYFENKVVLF